MPLVVNSTQGIDCTELMRAEQSFGLYLFVGVEWPHTQKTPAPMELKLI